MSLLKPRLLSLLVVLLPAAGLAQQDVRVAYSEPVRFIAEQDDGTGLNESSRVAPTLRFNALDRRFDLSLTSNMAIFSPELRERAGDQVVAYRGELDGVPGSWVRVVMANGVAQGVIWDGREMFAMEPADEGGSIIFRLSDLIIAPGTLSCGKAGSVVRTGQQLLNRITDEVRPSVAEAQGATLELEVGMVSDYEFSQEYSVFGPEAAIFARMNNVDGIFSRQIGVQLTLTQVDIFDVEADPFTDQDVAGDLLDEVSDYRRNNPEQEAAGLTHLFTGRDLATTTAGIAYVGALCSRSFGVGLTQATRNVTTDSLIAAHEFGHNFGARHDGEDGSGCESFPETFLMAPSVNGNDEFSSCSLDAIAIELASASCVSALSTSDVVVSAPAGVGQALMGESGTVEFEVGSVGSTPANNVTLDIQVASGGVFDSITVTSGSCTDVAGGAQCSLGSLATGTVVDVTVAATKDLPGLLDIDAVVTADNEDFTNNNEVSGRINFDPIADVQVTTADGSFAANTGAALFADIENLSNQRSSLLVISVQPAAGLLLNTAEWSRGNCTVTDNAAECEPIGLDGGASASLRLAFSGQSQGDFGYTVSAASPTFDPDQANNAATGQLSVTAPAPPTTTPPAPPVDSGGGGGGSADWWLLAWLAGLLLVVNRPAMRLRAKV